MGNNLATGCRFQNGMISYAVSMTGQIKPRADDPRPHFARLAQGDPEGRLLQSVFSSISETVVRRLALSTKEQRTDSTFVTCTRLTTVESVRLKLRKVRTSV